MKIVKAMDGGREAAKDFSNFFAGVMVEIGFTQSASDWLVFIDPASECRLLTHVDGPLAAASDGRMEWLWNSMEKFVLLKRGDRLQVGKLMKYLSKEYMLIATSVVKGVSVKHSDKYVKSILDIYNLTKGKVIQTPGIKDRKPSGKIGPGSAATTVEHDQYRKFVGKL